MPVYEYACPSCGVNFERQQPITANPIKTCPECGGRKVQRLISNTSFVLKGSGWYVTDYANKDKAPDKSSKKDADAAKKGGASESPGTSAASATPSDSTSSAASSSEKSGKPAADKPKTPKSPSGSAPAAA